VGDSKFGGGLEFENFTFSLSNIKILPKVGFYIFEALSVA